MATSCRFPAGSAILRVSQTTKTLSWLKELAGVVPKAWLSPWSLHNHVRVAQKHTQKQHLWEAAPAVKGLNDKGHCTKCFTQTIQ